MDNHVNELKERQENEVQALRSIFDHNFKDCREIDVWQVWRPPEFEILILPENTTQGHSEAFVSITLRIKFTQRYPEVKPEHRFTKTEGMSKEQLKELDSKIDALSSELEGNEMVYELCVEASHYLAKFNVKKFTSFAEEREENQKREAAKKEEGKRKLEKLKREAIAAKIAHRRLEIFEEQKRLKEEEDKRRMSESLEDNEVSGLTCHPVVGHQRRRRTESEECQDGVKELLLIVKGERVNVVRGKILGINNHQQKTYLGFCTGSGTLIALSRWMFPSKSKKNRKVKFDDIETDVGKALTALDQEMNSLLKLKHSNLVSYHGLTFSTRDGGVEAYLAQEFVNGVDLSGYLSGTRIMDLNMIRQVCEDILQGLRHLHASNIVHRDIRDTSIFMDNYGSFRLADFSVDSKLREIIEEKNDLNVEESFPPSVGRGGKKSDIYRIGLLVLSLKQGFIVKDQFPGLPRDIPDSMQDFVRNCLSRDEKSRWSAEQLLDHSFIKEPIVDIKLALRRNESPLKKPGSRSSSPDDNGRSNFQFSIPFTNGQSRLLQDFEILTWIGRGGFGDVIKVKNKLDEKKYAIKRIRLNPADRVTNRKIMREVKLLSRLNHENVVRYYNSWQEVTTLAPETGVTETSDNTEERTGASCSLAQDSVRAPATASEMSSVEWSVSFMPPSTESESEDSSDDELFCQPKAVTKELSSNSFIVFGSNSKSKVSTGEAEGSEETQDQSSSVASVSRQCHYMYIQMEFCDKQTLRTCIDNDLFKDTTKVWRMFREIVEGLVHIHTQGMIHRDLKPVNIFIDSHDHVKIGDFGLATAGLISQAVGIFF